MSTSLQFASLYDGQEVFMSSDCLLDLATEDYTRANLGTDFLVGNTVFV